MQINQKAYDEILVLAKTYGIKENIRVFSRNEYSEDFLIELEMNTSSIQQSAFEEEVTSLLCKETGRRIFTITEKDLEASVTKYKITELYKKLILTTAKPLSECIAAESLNQTPKLVIFSSSTESTPTSIHTFSNTASATCSK